MANKKKMAQGMKTHALKVGRQKLRVNERYTLLFLPPPRWPLLVKFTVSSVKA